MAVFTPANRDKEGYLRCEAIGAPLFNGNGWANTSLIQSDPLGVTDIHAKKKKKKKRTTTKQQ